MDKLQLAEMTAALACPPSPKNTLESVKKASSARHDFEARVRRHMAQMRVPGLYLDAHLKDFPQMLRDRVLVSISAGLGLYIHGRPGRGKTHLAIAQLRCFLTSLYRRKGSGQSLKYTHVNDMLMDIRDAITRRRGETEEDMINRYSSPDVLILDDLGVAKTSDWVVQTIDTIIDCRYRDGKLCIITSNLSLDELAAKFDDRIASRVSEMCTVVNMAGKDRRAEKAVARIRALADPYQEEVSHE